MALLDRLRYRPGDRYDGPVAFTDEDGYKRLPLGYYALTRDGKSLRRPLLRLVWVDDAPGDPDDGSGHYEVAHRSDPPVKAGRIVPLQSHMTGKGSVQP
ncbi:MAG: hypothetical protein HY323_05495 [Betaproteobacteria bacterium]|nr:hypothetical protein [Betaproteobacteria bacterium]